MLSEQLSAAGGQVEQIVVYSSNDVSQPDPEVAELLGAGRVDWVTVTSSSIARSLAAMFGDALGKSRLASISPVTSDVLRQLGYPPAAEASPYTMPGMVEAIIAREVSTSSTVQGCGALANIVASIRVLTPLKGKANPRSKPKISSSKIAMAIPVIHNALGIKPFPATAVTSWRIYDCNQFAAGLKGKDEGRRQG